MALTRPRHRRQAHRVKVLAVPAPLHIAGVVRRLLVIDVKVLQRGACIGRAPDVGKVVAIRAEGIAAIICRRAERDGLSVTHKTGKVYRVAATLHRGEVEMLAVGAETEVAITVGARYIARSRPAHDLSTIAKDNPLVALQCAVGPVVAVGTEGNTAHAALSEELVEFGTGHAVVVNDLAAAAELQGGYVNAVRADLDQAALLEGGHQDRLDFRSGWGREGAGAIDARARRRGWLGGGPRRVWPAAARAGRAARRADFPGQPAWPFWPAL